MLKQKLMDAVRKGLAGKNGSIPFPVDKLDEYIDIAKHTNYLLVGDTGAGKSTLAQDIILNILDWYYENQTNDLKLSVIYFGMERLIETYSARWVSRRIFIEEGVYIPTMKILGRKRKRDLATGKLTKEYDLMTPEEVEKVEFYSNIFDLWENDKTFVCIEGTHNPTGMKKYIDAFAAEHGTLADREDGPLSKQVYTPHHDNHIVLIITDYVGIVDEEKDRKTGEKKSTIDTYSKMMRKARDTYGFSPMNVQQLNRNVSDINRLKLNDLKPRISDIAESSQLARDADVVVAIFEPYRYVQEDTDRDLLGYSLKELRDEKGYTFYRSLHVLKNSFDASGIAIGSAFHPFTGLIKAMPKAPSMMTERDYESIRDGNYFLQVKRK